MDAEDTKPSCTHGIHNVGAALLELSRLTLGTRRFSEYLRVLEGLCVIQAQGGCAKSWIFKGLSIDWQYPGSSEYLMEG
jgi:hypothetical protein